MLKKAKWVKSEQASEPISHVAEAVIRQRLELVWHCAPMAAKKWHDDAENLHQMRVATRRSAAALVTFADLLPSAKTQKMLKRLKRLRKASGEARDLDVLTDGLRQELHAGREELAPLIEWLVDVRADAQQAIVAAVDRLAEKDFAKKTSGLCRRIRWRGDDDEPSYAVAARQLLATAGREFFAAAEKDLVDAHAMHALRIAGKQLRYTMEMLAGAFDSRFRDELYPLVREIQDKLGEINDLAAARARFEQWSTVAPAEFADRFAQLAAQQEQRYCELRREFLEWWTDPRKAALKESLLSFTEEAS